MAPKAMTTSTSLLKKMCNQPTTSLVVYETKVASSSTEISPRDYISLRNWSMEQVHLQKEETYPLVEPSIIEGFIVEGDMLSMIPSLKYAHHDITDEKKLWKIISSKFLMKSISSNSHMIVIEPQLWDMGLYKVGLITLVDIPHFG
jgi:hypothetical protein